MVREPGRPVRGEAVVYPIFLTNVAQVHAVVVGGGHVAERKVDGLLAAGMRVTVISPDLTHTLVEYSRRDELIWVARPYQSGDLAGAGLAFAATNERSVNAQVAQDAAVLGILCNVADAPEEGSFHVPAVHRQPGLVVAVGSGGANPARAVQVRDRIAAMLKDDG